MKHHLALAQYAIIGTFALFLLFIVLFNFEGEFAGQATTGTTANISPSAPANCTLSIEPGHNLVSLPCITTVDPVDNITQGMPVVAMYQYVPAGNDRWRVYNPGLPGYVISDLTVMTRRAGYVITANGSAAKLIEGRRTAYTEVPLVPGWNLVGYPKFNESNTSDATASINTSYSIIVGYDRTAGEYVNYTPDGQGTLTILRPGEGYWINATAAASWGVGS